MSPAPQGHGANRGSHRWSPVRLSNAPASASAARGGAGRSFTSVAAVLLYVRAVHVLGASQTSFFFVLVPVFGTLLAAIVLDERVSAVQGAGIAAVAVAMMLATFRRRD